MCVHAEGEKRFVLEADVESLTGTDEHKPVVSALRRQRQGEMDQSREAGQQEHFENFLVRLLSLWTCEYVCRNRVCECVCVGYRLMSYLFQLLSILF